MDKVKCNWCGETSIVTTQEDYCPKCNQKGYLMDIQQDFDER